ncbi:MAG: SAM-dependent methyltransferase [Planctomycetota bacterium]
MLPFNPILSHFEFQQLAQARQEKKAVLSISLDIQKSQQTVELSSEHWGWEGHFFPYEEEIRPNTFYIWEPTQNHFVELLQEDPFTGGIVKLAPTSHGPPNFHINGIQMLPQKKVNPFLDAQQKVKLVRPRGKRVLDTCGGLGYFAYFCLEEGAEQIISFEINPAVLWLRERNPWSPKKTNLKLQLTEADVFQQILLCADRSFECILHDPPRFSIAGDLYSLAFYRQLYRVMKPRGILFHYTGNPFQFSHGRMFIQEVGKRLEKAGFRTQKALDGLLVEKI